LRNFVRARRQTWSLGCIALSMVAGAWSASRAQDVDVASTTSPPPADPAALRTLVSALDRAMFDAYNAHDVERLMALFAPELEFFHDTGGLIGHDAVRTGFTRVFAGNPDIRRELVPGTLQVYPIKDYGAIEIGAHRFCHTENGKLDCGTFQFLHVWKYDAGHWQVSRAVSYGH
jgi:ketosteroid isomerase-like protein